MKLNNNNELALQPTIVKRELNELMNVSLVEGNAIQLTDEFSYALNQITTMVQAVERLTNMDIATIEEDELDMNMKELAEAQKLRKLVTEARKAVRKEFDNMRDTNVALLDSLLDNAGFSELERIDRDTKKIKEDIRAHRINNHWEDLRPTFDATIQTFEAISRLAPKLAEFSTFRIRNPKMVTGAKTFKVTDKHRGELNNEMNMINQNLLQIEENKDGLSMDNQFNLLKDFIAKPTNENYLTRSTYYKELEIAQQQAEIKRQEQLKLQQEQQEQMKKAQLEQQQAQAQLNQQAPQLKPNTQQPPVGVTMFNQKEAFQRPQATNDFAWLAELITMNPTYHDIASNNRVKVALLYDLFTQITEPSSVFYKNTLADHEKVMKIVNYITNL